MSGFPNNDLPAASGGPAGLPHPVSPLTDQGEAPVALGVSMSGSYVKLYRKWLDSEIAREPITSHLFTHMLLRAARFPREREMYGYRLEIGELDETQEQLATASGLSRKQVRTCYTKMKNACMISTRAVGHGRGRQRNVTTIVNYATYQIGDDDKGHQVGTQTAPQTGTQGANKGPVLKKGKKVEKENKLPPPEWASALALELARHVQAELGVNTQDQQLKNWAYALDRLTRSRALAPAPEPDEIQTVLRWGMSNREVSGAWTGWAAQIRSAPDANKYAKIRQAMSKRPATTNKVSPQHQRGLDSDEYN